MVVGCKEMMTAAGKDRRLLGFSGQLEQARLTEIVIGQSESERK